MRGLVVVLKSAAMERSFFRISDFFQPCGFPFCDPLPEFWDRVGHGAIPWDETGGRAGVLAEDVSRGPQESP